MLVIALDVTDGDSFLDAGTRQPQHVEVNPLPRLPRWTSMITLLSSCFPGIPKSLPKDKLHVLYPPMLEAGTCAQVRAWNMTQRRDPATTAPAPASQGGLHVLTWDLLWQNRRLAFPKIVCFHCSRCVCARRPRAGSIAS